MRFTCPRCKRTTDTGFLGLKSLACPKCGVAMTAEKEAEEPQPEPAAADTSSSEEGWGTVVFARPSKSADMSRGYQMFMDGDYIGAINGGQEWTIALPPGEHEFQAKIYWCSSKALKVNLEPGFTYHIEVGSNVSGVRAFLAVPCMFFRPSRYLYLVVVDRAPYAYEEVGVRDI